MTPADWLAAATADIEKRQLVELRPILDSLAHGMTTLRAADWNDDASGRGQSRANDDDDR
jgi:hypothetical protein